MKRLVSLRRQSRPPGGTGTRNTGRAICAAGKRDEHEDGAVLILTLVFIIIVSLSMLGLITFGGTGILNATNLKGQRSLEFAADGATTAAVQAVRYSYNGFITSSEQDCLPDGAVFSLTSPDTQTLTINGITMTVDCTAAPMPTSSPNVTRAVLFDACQTAPCSANNSIVIATVYFTDISTSGVNSCSSPTNSSTCGVGMTINSWIVETANN